MLFGKFLYSKKIFLATISISIIAYILSCYITTNDTSFTYRWIAFWLHIFSIVILFLLYIGKNLSKSTLKKAFSETEINPIIFITVITAIANFLLLAIYPYVSIADELRDGGLFAMKIASGQLPNIFAYGSYDAHGLIIPTVDVPFYYLFSSSVLTYRFPAALFSTADVLLLYWFVRIVAKRTTAFWSALVLATMPLHMFFAHTQIVVAFNFFWVPAILLLLVNLLKRHTALDYIFLGTALGFASGFHAAVRVFCCLIILLVFLLELQEVIKRRFTFDHQEISRIGKFILFFVFFFVGFGPRLLFTQPQIFFHTSRFVYENNIEQHTSLTMDDATNIKNNYIRSLMIYIYEPTTFMYPDYHPLFPPFLAIFFVLGIGYAIFILKNFFVNILLYLLIVLPFFTSAITDSINADYRASPLFAIASVFIGLGITYTLTILKSKIIQYIFIGIMLLYLSIQILNFYTLQPANKNVPLNAYLSMHIFYQLQATKQFQSSPASYLQVMNTQPLPNNACVVVSPTNYQYLNNNLGAIEQQQFLVPNVNIEYLKDDAMLDNEAAILHTRCPSHIPNVATMNTHVIYCVTNQFVCPLGDLENIVIHD